MKCPQSFVFITFYFFFSLPWGGRDRISVHQSGFSSIWISTLRQLWDCWLVFPGRCQSHVTVFDCLTHYESYLTLFLRTFILIVAPSVFNVIWKCFTSEAIFSLKQEPLRKLSYKKAKHINDFQQNTCDWCLECQEKISRNVKCGVF